MRSMSKAWTRGTHGAHEDRSGVEASAAELAALRPLAAARCTVKARRATARLAGTSRSAVRGRGIEFAEVRTYAPGDEVRHIDWRVTARTGTPHSKLFEEERERPVVVVVDLRSPMRFGTRQCFKSVAAARAAALEVWTAVLRNDRIGGVVLDDSGLTPYRMRRDRNATRALIAGLADATSRGAEATADARPIGLVDALMEARRMTGPSTEVFVLSDFSDLDLPASRQLAALARRTRTTCVLVHDPLEAEAPTPGQYRVTNGEKVAALGIASESSRAAWVAPFEGRVRTLSQLCRESGAQLEQLATASEALGFQTTDRPGAHADATTRTREAS